MNGPNPNPAGHASFGKTSRWRAFGLALSLACASSPVLLSACESSSRTLVTTVGDLRAVHADVFVEDHAVKGEQRVEQGARLRTGKEGRARLRLDDGTIIAIDGEAELALESDGRLVLSAGRIFVQGGPHAATRVGLGAASTLVTDSAVAFEANPEKGGKLTVSNGELVVQTGDQQARVQSGETATFDGESVAIVPEKAFEDWTGGLAVPWTSGLGGRSTVPVVRAVQDETDAGTALVVRSQDIDVQLDGELALTRATTRYFNGSSSAARLPVRLALPDGAILRRVAKRTNDGEFVEADVRVAASPSRSQGPALPGLEWAGGGWLRGELDYVSAGQTADLVLEYVEWLPTRSGTTSYRFLMDGGDAPPLIGELNAEIAASPKRTRFISASAGATASEDTVRYRDADSKPTSDLVVEFEDDFVEAGVARAYTQQPPGQEDAFVMVRTEVPDKVEQSVSLVIVVDASMSIGAAPLETQRAVVDAILAGLSPADSVAVLAADTELHALGPKTPSAATAEVLAQIRQALSSLRPGGASNLGACLVSAADLLDSPSRGDGAGSGMLVYVGDGRPSVGEPDARALRRLLSKRSGGMPRLGAIAAGPNADKWLLARLVAGTGSVHTVLDRSDAARAGAAVLADALRPTLRDVKLDLGPNVDRIYPRDSGAIIAGSTVTVLGRLRGELPKTVGFSYRDGAQLKTETRRLRRLRRPKASDLPKRWAAARVEEMALRDEGIEPAIALASEAGLLTPWTGWFFRAPSDDQGTRPFAERLLTLSPSHDAAFATRLGPALGPGSTLLEPFDGDDRRMSLREAAQVALRRILDKASKAVQACRDARASVRPDVGRTFSIDLAVDADGKATRVRVVLVDTPGRNDRALARCIENVVRALPYFGVGVPVDVTHDLTVAEGRSSRRTKCSEASKISLPLRKSIWRARAVSAGGYTDAARSCELPRWRDRRGYLMLLLEVEGDGERRLAIARELEQDGHADAARFVREQTLRQVNDFEELRQLTRILRADEPPVADEFDKAYEKASTDPERLKVVRTFLQLAPHDGYVLRRLFALLEAMGNTDTLVDEIRKLRAEPIVDAGLLAAGASALRRIGMAKESRRAFGELLERAPSDPWTLAYVGDRLRAEGLFDEAGEAYDSLSRTIPNDASVSLRMALAHAGAGRLDVATRLLDRVAQTGGRGDDGRLGELASITQAYLLANAREAAPASVREELERRLLQTPLPDVKGFIFVQSAPADDGLDVRIIRKEGENAEQSPDLDARSVGIAAIRLERGEGDARIELRRQKQAGPSRARDVVVAALLISEGRDQLRVIERKLEVAADGDAVELTFDGEQLL